MGEEEFLLLYQQMAPRIVAMAARRCGRQEAQEVASATFEVAWRKRASAPRGDAMVRAWLLRIALYECKQNVQRIMRKHHDHRFVDDHDTVALEAGNDTAREAVDRVSASSLYGALSDEEQELLEVAFLSGLDAAEIAAALGVSKSVLSTRVFRLRSKLSSMLVGDSDG